MKNYLQQSFSLIIMFQIDLLISFRLRFGVNKEMRNLLLLMFHQNHEFSIRHPLIM
jgi:hypothetical protein